MMRGKSRTAPQAISCKVKVHLGTARAALLRTKQAFLGVVPSLSELLGSLARKEILAESVIQSNIMLKEPMALDAVDGAYNYIK